MDELLEGGERRNLSVLVLDIAGSSGITSRLDPEDYHDLFSRLGVLWQQAIEEFGGHVMKWTGDGLMAVFGYPHAHDNDAVRAGGRRDARDRGHQPSADRRPWDAAHPPRPAHRAHTPQPHGHRDVGADRHRR